jgi:DNA-binding MarR family transcriptional regulator
MRQVDQEPPSSGEVLDFMRLVWAVDSGLQAVSGEMEAVFGLTGAERVVLRVLAQYRPLCSGELAEILGMSRGATSVLLKSLDEAGYIQRKSDPEDRRRTIVSLTRRGRTVSEAHACNVEAAVRRVLGGVTGRTIDSAKLVLSALASELSVPEAIRARSKA